MNERKEGNERKCKERNEWKDGKEGSRRERKEGRKEARMKVRRVYLYYWTGVDGFFINSYFRDYCVVCLCEGVEGLCTHLVFIHFAMFTSYHMLTFILHHILTHNN